MGHDQSQHFQSGHCALQINKESFSKIVNQCGNSLILQYMWIEKTTSNGVGGGEIFFAVYHQHISTDAL